MCDSVYMLLMIWGGSTRTVYVGPNRPIVFLSLCAERSSTHVGKYKGREIHNHMKKTSL